MDAQTLAGDFSACQTSLDAAAKSAATQIAAAAQVASDQSTLTSSTSELAAANAASVANAQKAVADLEAYISDVSAAPLPVVTTAAASASGS